MKKAVSIILTVLAVLTMFTACGKKDTAAWEKTNEAFKDVVVYKYGNTISADYSSTCSIKVEDGNYKNFVKYVSDLKKAGFEYFGGDIPENLNLNDGQANWRCSNGKVYLQLIYSETGTKSYDMFGCNLQIYGYSEKPDSWEASKTGKDDETTAGDKAESTTKGKKESATKAEKTTEKATSEKK